MGTMKPPRPLPPEVETLCEKLQAQPKLLRHLQVVHDVATDLVEGLHRLFPKLVFDGDAVLFGAATHDLGKVLRNNELTGAGSNHEVDGPIVLQKAGVSPELSRFAGTHGTWNGDLPLEDLLVALADALWKGRLPQLEDIVARKIAAMLGVQEWEVFFFVDELANELSADGQERLAWCR